VRDTSAGPLEKGFRFQYRAVEGQLPPEFGQILKERSGGHVLASHTLKLAMKRVSVRVFSLAESLPPAPEYFRSEIQNAKCAVLGHGAKGMKVEKGRGLAMVNMLSRRAKEALLQFKKDRGITAILPRSENQKIETKRYNRRKRIEDAHEARKMSRGAASEVRIIKPEE